MLPSPPNHLNRIRALNLIKAFKELWHVVHIISLYKTNKEKTDLDAISTYVDSCEGVYQPFWWSLLCCFIALFLPIPLRIAFCFNPFLLVKLFFRKEKNEYDLIYIKRLRMAQYTYCFSKNKTYIDFTDSMTKWYQNVIKVSSGIKRILSFEEYLKHKIYEVHIANKYPNILICSESDREYLISIGAKKEHIHILENGIFSKDWSFFRFNREYNHSINLVFWGVMNADTNISSVDFFLSQIMPYLPEQYKYTIIGPKPPTKLFQHQNNRINFLGHVSALQEELKKHDLFICSITAGVGTKNKILQSALIGLPIISSELWVDGIVPDLKNKIHIYKTQEDLIKFIKDFSPTKQDQKKLEEIRNITIHHYDIIKIVKRFIDSIDVNV